MFPAWGASKFACHLDSLLQSLGELSLCPSQADDISQCLRGLYSPELPRARPRTPSSCTGFGEQSSRNPHLSVDGGASVAKSIFSAPWIVHRARNTAGLILEETTRT